MGGFPSRSFLGTVFCIPVGITRPTHVALHECVHTPETPELMEVDDFYFHLKSLRQAVLRKSAIKIHN